MEKIDIKINKYNFSFGIDKVKFLVSRAPEKIFSVIQAIRKTINKINDSEYEIENTVNKRFLINDKQINLKENLFFFINNHFDLEKDLKLQSKSLLGLYIDSLLENIEYDDDLNTINILINDLSNRVSEYSSENTFQNLNINISELNQKTILKLIEIYLIKEELIQNAYEMSYTENIVFQLELLSFIASKKKNINYWTILEIPVITDSILTAIHKTASNVKVIAWVESIKCPIQMDDVVLIKNKSIDLSDELQIYENILLDNNQNIHSLAELKEAIVSELNSNDSKYKILDNYI